MAMAELSTPKTTSTFLQPSYRLRLSSKSYLSNQFRHLLLPPHHTPSNSKNSCSVSQKYISLPPVAVQDNGSVKTKKECYGIFCLTYHLKAEEETKSWKKMINIAVSGAAGMISNHLLFKLASGAVFGPDQPIALKLLGSERSIQALSRILLGSSHWCKTSRPWNGTVALLDISGRIFAEQGKALNAVASPNVKVLVNFHALTRLDENRAKCQLALKAGVFYDKVSNMTIWGKSLHDSEVNQVPNFLNARINGRPVKEVITDHKWLEEGFTESVQKRGGLLIQKWGRSSAASTAVSIVDAIKSLVTPTPEGDWFSTGVYTNGNPYGIAEDLVFSMPCRSKRDGDYELVKDVELDDYLRNRIAKSEAELLAEKKCVAHLTGDGISFCDLGPVDTMLPGEV
ncbi:hypothetical protein Bca52824_022420 [Brassica carinata]|uniref:Lactate/malate dehydrogenase C-terminal domain-containing protein n=1 Tax=Brassica carinata TaxID=52824 RepID=A0A8X7VG19_BRACI|nr:hypothetical protein Bca52824_022420 [Brassica carinata]